VKDPSADVVGRAFSGAAFELALASYPGFALTSQPGTATPYGVYWPALVPADEVVHVVVHHDGRREVVPHTPGGPPEPLGRARTDDAADWLLGWLDEKAFRQLLPEADGLDVSVHGLPNLRAVNVVVHGLLGEGVAASTRFDPQAKGLGEYLRSRLVDVPVSLLG
jgi:hypothetical protein